MIRAKKRTSAFPKTSDNRRAAIVKSGTAAKYKVGSTVAKLIDKKKLKIQRRGKLLVTTVHEIGLELLAIKRLLPHGAFEPFVIDEFPFSVRKAQMCMNCVAIAGQNPDIISRFLPTALYKLAAPGTPDTVRELFLTRMRQGQPCPSLNMIEREIEKARKCEIEMVRESKLPVQVINRPWTVVEFFVEFDFDVLIPPASELLAIFIANIPQAELGRTARLLRGLDSFDLMKMASKLAFKALRSHQLNNSDDCLEARWADSAA